MTAAGPPRDRPLLAVDGGQTGLRVRVRAGGRGADAEVAGFGYGPGDPVATNTALLRQAWHRLPAWAHRAPACAALGLTGQLGPGAAAARLATAVAAVTGAARVRIAEDAVTAHLGALRGRAGIVVAAGTGTVALAVAPTGRAHRVDGWGHVLGDGGSGFALGRAGLRLVVAAHDGRGGATALTAAARRRYGPVEALPSRLYRSPSMVADVAGFAVDVLAAARGGDEPAAAAVATAVRRLVDTTVAAAAAYARLTGDLRGQTGGTAPAVSGVGGVFAADDLVWSPWAAAVGAALPGWAVVAPAGTGLAGVELLADNAEPAGWAGLLLHDGPGATAE